MITPEKVAELRALLTAATPGPWEVYQTIHAEPWVAEVGRGMFGAVCAPATGRERYGLDNANLIAAAVSALPDLLDELARLQGLVATESAAKDRARNERQRLSLDATLNGLIAAELKAGNDERAAALRCLRAWNRGAGYVIQRRIV